MFYNFVGQSWPGHPPGTRPGKENFTVAKLKAPLLSMGASGQLGKTLVFFPWKGLNVAREFVVPANPKTSGQTTQRGYITAAVAAIHTAQADAANPLNAVDVLAYTLLANQEASPRTWFNQVVSQWADQNVAAKKGCIFHDMVIAAGAAGEIDVDLLFTEEGANTVSAGTWFYGTSPTALIYSVAATIGAGRATDTLTGLTTGQKYYIQFRPTAHADFVGTKSGIYHQAAG